LPEFTLPDFAHTYINNVRDRSIDLITYKIWNGLNILDLKKWLNNFEGDLEQYFAACILDALVFRSEEQLVAQAKELFTKKICNLLSKNGYILPHYSSFIDILKGSPNSDFRLVSVSNRNERPVKSSNLILRLYKRKLGFNENWFITPDEVEKEHNVGIKNFIFVDDFLGTGKQFYSMYRGYGFSLLLKDCTTIYAPLVAHEFGMNYLTENFPEVAVTSSETLDDDDNVFNHAFEDGINSPENAKIFYTMLLKKYKFVNLLPENEYGYGNLGLVYTFSHSSPDNCLNIIWDSQNSWNPLVRK